MLHRIGIITVALVVLVGPSDERKQIIILNSTSRNLDGVLHTAISETVRIIAGGRDSDHQLVRETFHGFFESVVLCRLLVGRQLVSDCKVAVEGILCIRVRCHYLNVDGAIRYAVIVECVLDGMFHRVVFYIKVTGDAFIIQREFHELE